MARAAREGPLAGLLADQNIAGFAYGRRIVDGGRTDEPAVVVYVLRKVPEQFLPTSRLLPRRLYFGRDAIEVDVVETGPFYAQSFTARERPAPNGVSIGHFNVTAGTLGSLVIDNTDRTVNILSNNHVLADGNNAMIGDAIVQPGVFDGGTTAGDTIATLKRFVTLNANGNTADAAIAQPRDPNDVEDRVKNDLIPVATPDHPAIGLLFAGTCNRTLINPIDQVLTQLNVEFLGGAAVTAGVDIGTNVEKVGRTTEYTTSTVTEIDVTALVQYASNVIRSFDGQIATAYMSEGGDSGSVVYRGGEGGNEDACGCGSAAAASQVLQRDLKLDQSVEREFRQRHLQQTRVGRYLVDTYFANESRILERNRRTELDEATVRTLQGLYDKYAETARAVALQPLRSEATVTDEHLEEAREALARMREHLRADEAEVAEEALGIARDFVGRTAAEILRALDETELLRRVRSMVDRVEFLTQPDNGR
ncbi:hypothetical protein [Nonomuraea sp. NPDC005692]|uniref:hypothetical protein n=1 Tax=Nonomuraea sp. NPDC005692 TaxID=3157168 RepID=UPI0033FE7581